MRRYIHLLNLKTNLFVTNPINAQTKLEKDNSTGKYFYATKYFYSSDKESITPVINENVLKMHLMRIVHYSDSDYSMIVNDHNLNDLAMVDGKGNVIPLESFFVELKKYKKMRNKLGSSITNQIKKLINSQNITSDTRLVIINQFLIDQYPSLINDFDIKKRIKLKDQTLFLLDESDYMKLKFIIGEPTGNYQFVKMSDYAEIFQ